MERTNALIDNLADQPVSVGDQLVGPDELVAQLSDLTNSRANYIPRMIAELETGDATSYLVLSNREVGTQAPEGATTSAGVDQLINQISEAAGRISAGNIMGSLQIVADILKGAQQEQPKEAMKALTQEKLAESEDLPKIIERIENLTPEEIDEGALPGFPAGVPCRLGRGCHSSRLERLAHAGHAGRKRSGIAGRVCNPVYGLRRFCPLDQFAGDRFRAAARVIIPGHIQNYAVFGDI